MMLMQTNFRSPGMGFSLKINIFESQVISDLPIDPLSAFDDVPFSIKRFKLGIVYHRYSPSAPFPDTDPSSDSMLSYLDAPPELLIHQISMIFLIPRLLSLSILFPRLILR